MKTESLFKFTMSNGETEFVKALGSDKIMSIQNELMNNHNSLVDKVEYLFSTEFNDKPLKTMCWLNRDYICIVEGGFFASDAYLKHGNFDGVHGESFGIRTHDDGEFYKENKRKIKPLTTNQLFEHIKENHSKYNKQFLIRIKTLLEPERKIIGSVNNA